MKRCVGQLWMLAIQILGEWDVLMSFMYPIFDAIFYSKKIAVILKCCCLILMNLVYMIIEEII